MFPSLPIVQDITICLRCQYRIAARRRLGRGQTSRTRKVVRPRFFASGQPVLQEQVEQRSAAAETPGNVSESGKSKRYPFTSAGIRSKHPVLHTKSSLGIDALGEPAEILLLRNELSQSLKRKEDQIFGEVNTKVNSLLSSDDMLASIEAERGIVGADRVRANIESLKDVWTSNLRDRFGPPALDEVENLAQHLQNGFTAKQLLNYFEEAGLSAASDPLEINQDFSSELYKRSAWIPGVTSFPEVAITRLQSLDLLKHNTGSRELMVKTKKNPLKKVLADKIIRQLWHIQTEHQKETSGEVEVWIQSEYLDLLLNHSEYSRNLFFVHEDLILCRKRPSQAFVRGL